MFLHPSSVTYNTGHFENPYLVYHEKIKTSRVFLREVSMVPVYPMVLFGGTGVEVTLQRGKFVLSLEGGNGGGALINDVTQINKTGLRYVSRTA